MAHEITGPAKPKAAAFFLRILWRVSRRYRTRVIMARLMEVL